MSSDLFNACANNNMEEAMRLLTTASNADVNYRHEVLVDINCINLSILLKLFIIISMAALLFIMLHITIQSMWQSF